MADDRMKKDDQQRNMGTGREDQDFGKQAPARGEGGQQPGQQGQQGQKGARNLEDDDEFATGQPGGQNRGGQNR